MVDERVNLTADQAIRSLIRSENNEVHVTSGGGMLIIGADWSAESVESTIRNAKALHIGGPNCKAMKHGLVVDDSEGKRWFVNADNDILDQYEREAKK